MKVAPIVVFLFRDAEGFASAISEALHPNPSSFFSRIEDSFEFSLEVYGIKELKASGNAFHYVDNHGTYQVSVVVMQHYEPPVLACALNEVLHKIAGDGSSSMPTLLAPFLVESSKVKGKSISTRSGSKPLIFGIQIGQNTDIMQTLLHKTHKPPSTLQIQHEPFACLLHFVRVIRLPTFFLIGQTGQYLVNTKSSEQLEIIRDIGEILASGTGLQFSEDKVIWNPKKASRESKEPWRDLYG